MSMAAALCSQHQHQASQFTKPVAADSCMQVYILPSHCTSSCRCPCACATPFLQLSAALGNTHPPACMLISSNTCMHRTALQSSFSDQGKPARRAFIQVNLRPGICGLSIEHNVFAKADGNAGSRVPVCVGAIAGEKCC